MRGEIIIGTVRGTRNGRHVVVLRDGKTMDVNFEGGQKPLIGSDVIGRVTYNNVGEPTMSLRSTLLETLLEGNARIMLAGSRPDLTARMLAKVLSRAKGATISPGVGSSFQRMTHTDDPDLAWALDVVKPEADRLGIALNVIDVRKVARSVWQNAALRDGVLPADIEGSRRSMGDLIRLLRSGFNPDCSRMVEQYTGNREISVNFVLPYSPFAGASGFIRAASFMELGGMPIATMTVSESRKLSSLRTMCLALAHEKLSAGGGLQSDASQSRRAAHLANAFADAAASLAFLANGGRREAVEEYADAKEAAFVFGLDHDGVSVRDGVLVEATQRAIRMALAADPKAGMPMSEVLDLAVKLAKRHALPAARFGGATDLLTTAEIADGVEAANRIATNIREERDHDNLLACADIYRTELRELADEHCDSPVASARLATFGRLNVPHGLSYVFHEEMVDLSPSYDAEVPGTVVDMAAGHARFADRLRVAKAARDDDTVMFAEPMAR